MTSFSEDKIFKNINDNDARILLDIIDVTSVKVKIWTKELRLYDPKDFVPDIILELDYENIIFEPSAKPPTPAERTMRATFSEKRTSEKGIFSARSGVRFRSDITQSTSPTVAAAIRPAKSYTLNLSPAPSHAAKRRASSMS